MTEHAGHIKTLAASIYARMAVLLILGLVYVFSIPMFEAPDEPCHFARAYGIAEGQFILKDHSRALVLFIYENMKTRHADHPVLVNMKRLLDEQGDRIPNVTWNTALYSPVPYLFHACAIKMVLVFSNSTQGLRVASYLCRFITLCLFVGLIFLSSRISSESSWPLFWVAATPMALAQASIISIDFIVLGTSALLLCMCLGNLTTRSYTVYLVISSFLLVTAKPTYIPLLLIPAVFMLYAGDDIQAHGPKPFLLALAISVAAFFIWNYFMVSYDVFNPMAEGWKRFLGLELDPSFQMKWIVQSPLQFLIIVKNSLASSYISLAHQFVGVLGWLDAPIPIFLVAMWWILSIPAILISDPVAAVSYGKKLSMGLLFIAVALGVILCIYISGFMMWTSVGSTSIPTQGRYFHPVIFALFLGLAIAKPIFIKDRFKRYFGYGLLAMSGVINITALLTTFLRH